MKTILRLTRSSYRRKLIMFGVSVFTSLALMASGFAAWVLSQDATGKLDGNVTVGAVSEAEVEVTIQFVDDNNAFVFEPREDDNSGRVRNDGTSFEDLDIQFTWTIENYQSVPSNGHTVDLYIPVGVKAAIDAGYIKLPANFDWVKDETVPTNAKVTNWEGGADNYNIARVVIPAITQNGSAFDGALTYTFATSGGVDTATFTYTVAFSWGDDETNGFNSLNPGVYFDEDSVGSLKTYDQVKTALDTFKATVHGLTLDAYRALDADEVEALTIPSYHILVTAKVGV